MRALKVIVILLGLIIAGGLGLLVYGLSQGWHQNARSDAPAQLAAVPDSVQGQGAQERGAQGWGRVVADRAPGARLKNMTGAGDLVVAHIEDEGGANARLLVLNPRTGAVVGVFAFGDAR